MIIPIFRIFDIEKAQSFYMDYLGFRMDWEHRFSENMPVYLQISFNDTILHLSEHHGDSTPGSAIRIKMNDLVKYHSSLSTKEYPYANPALEKTPWNTMEVTVIDPFSNKIIFYEDINNES